VTRTTPSEHDLNDMWAAHSTRSNKASYDQNKVDYVAA